MLVVSDESIACSIVSPSWPQCTWAIPGYQVLWMGFSDCRPRTIILVVHRLAVNSPDNDVQKQYLESVRVSIYVKNGLTKFYMLLDRRDSFMFHIPVTRVYKSWHAHNVKLTVILPAYHSYARMRTPLCVTLISKNVADPFRTPTLGEACGQRPGQVPQS